MTDRAASSCWPTIRRLCPPTGRKTAAVGSLMATASPSHAVGPLADVGQHLLPPGVVEPDDLEQVVPRHQPVLVVVDRLARPGEQPGRRVLLTQDELGVRVR